VLTLDIGCGRQKEAGAIGLDMNPATDADVLADVSSSPLPVRPESVDRIFIRHIIEHVDSPLRFMEELHAAARDGAKIEGVTPHFSNPCSFADPTHKHHFSLMFLNFFSGDGERASSGWRLWANRFLECYYPPIPFYTRARFEIIERRITFCRLHRWIGVAWLANQFPEIWEFHFSGFFRARDIVFRLCVRK